MKYLTLTLLVFCLSCQKQVVDDPAASLSLQQQEQFKYNVIRYIEKLAPKASQTTKFDSVYNSYYKEVAQKCELLYYYKNPENQYIYFAIAQNAPSLKVKKVATVGKLKLDSNAAIQDYEEAFRTWRMEDSELKTKTKMLFSKYVAGEDLTNYETANAKGAFYIEFPDGQTKYNKELRMWETQSTTN